jgi:hypothetical protein
MFYKYSSNPLPVQNNQVIINVIVKLLEEQSPRNRFKSIPNPSILDELLCKLLILNFPTNILREREQEQETEERQTGKLNQRVFIGWHQFICTKLVLNEFWLMFLKLNCCYIIFIYFLSDSQHILYMKPEKNLWTSIKTIGTRDQTGIFPGGVKYIYLRLYLCVSSVCILVLLKTFIHRRALIYPSSMIWRTVHQFLL